MSAPADNDRPCSACGHRPHGGMECGERLTETKWSNGLGAISIPYGERRTILVGLCQCGHNELG